MVTVGDRLVGVDGGLEDMCYLVDAVALVGLYLLPYCLASLKFPLG